MAEPVNKELQDIIDKTQSTSYHVGIQPCNRGYIVTIGCSTWAFEKKAAMLNAISAYLDDPEDAIAYFNERHAEVVGADVAPTGPAQVGYGNTTTHYPPTSGITFR